jgi:protein gp37
MGTKIEWTRGDDGSPGETWNPTTGCEKVSDGCTNCYAEKITERFHGKGSFAEVTLHPDRLDAPLRWRKPHRVFVNSMSDLFHQDVPDEFIAQVFAVMAMTPQHSYQILTKRHGRMRSLLANAERGAPSWLDLVRGWVVGNSYGAPGSFSWPLLNVWLGVSVEDQKRADLRIPALLGTPASIRFLSCEPLLSSVDLSPWLGDTCGCVPESGGRDLSGSGVGRVSDRPSGTDLAACGSQEGSLGRAAQDHSVPAAAGGERGEVLPGPVDGQRHARTRLGASSGVAALSGPDFAGADGQPQERAPQGQQAVEPGASHITGTGPACQDRPPPWSARPVRGTERDGEALDGAGAGDLFTSGGRGADSCPRCGLRRSRANHLANREGRPSLSWIIVGGESGPGARPMELDWARSLVEQCRDAGVPVFVKQDSGPKPGMQGRIPDNLWIKEFPAVVPS